MLAVGCMSMSVVMGMVLVLARGNATVPNVPVQKGEQHKSPPAGSASTTDLGLVDAV